MFNWRDDNYWIAINGIMAVGFICWAKRLIQQARQAKMEQTKIKNAPVYELDQFLKERAEHMNFLQSLPQPQQKKSKKSYLVKTNEPLSQKLMFEQVFSNQIKCLEPSVQKIMQKKDLIFHYMPDFANPIPQKEFKLQGYESLGIAKSLAANVFQCKTYHINRHQILKMQYQPAAEIKLNNDDALILNPEIINYLRSYPTWNSLVKNCQESILKTFWMSASLLFQSTFMFLNQFIFPEIQARKNNLTFKGVCNGLLLITLKKIQNMFIVLKINLDGKNTQIELLGNNKLSLLRFFSQKQTTCVFFLFYLAVPLSFNLFFLSRLMGKKIRKLKNKVYQHFYDPQYFNPKNIADDKLCSICYKNCRNVLFHSCRHLVMCFQCYEDHKQYKCMMCNKGIDKIHLIKADPSQSCDD